MEIPQKDGQQLNLEIQQRMVVVQVVVHFDRPKVFLVLALLLPAMLMIGVMEHAEHLKVAVIGNFGLI